MYITITISRLQTVLQVDARLHNFLSVGYLFPIAMSFHLPCTFEGPVFDMTAATPSNTKIKEHRFKTLPFVAQSKGTVRGHLLIL